MKSFRYVEWPKACFTIAKNQSWKMDGLLHPSIMGSDPTCTGHSGWIYDSFARVLHESIVSLSSEQRGDKVSEKGIVPRYHKKPIYHESDRNVNQ
jgi:hypothetical protein